MSIPTDRANRLNQAQLRIFGEAIVYTPAGGDPMPAVGIWRKTAIEQSTTYFGSIEVDPAAIPEPKKGDVVTWTDGVDYVVGRAIAAPYELTVLQLHRKIDLARGV